MAVKKSKSRWTSRQRAEFYMRQRREYANTTFNAVGAFAMPFFRSNAPMRLVERDEELMAALEAWRLRQLAKIDEQLLNLGIADPAALQDDLEKLADDQRAARFDVIEAALQARREPEYQLCILSEPSGPKGLAQK